jgi:hypothetical protein
MAVAVWMMPDCEGPRVTVGPQESRLRRDAAVAIDDESSKTREVAWWYMMID